MCPAAGETTKPVLRTIMMWVRYMLGCASMWVSTWRTVQARSLLARSGSPNLQTRDAHRAPLQAGVVVTTASFQAEFADKPSSPLVALKERGDRVGVGSRRLQPLGCRDLGS